MLLLSTLKLCSYFKVTFLRVTYLIESPGCWKRMLIRFLLSYYHFYHTIILLQLTVGSSSELKYHHITSFLLSLMIMYFFYFCCSCFVLNQISACVPDWSQTLNPPASVSQALWLLVGTTRPGLLPMFVLFLFLFCYRRESWSKLTISYTL